MIVYVDDLMKDFPFRIVLIAYLALMSIITFAFYGHDKKAARMKQRRTPEKTLFLLNFIGGFLGGWIGMYFFHHKTKHKNFYIVQFVSAFLWNCLLVFVFLYL